MKSKGRKLLSLLLASMLVSLSIVNTINGSEDETKVENIEEQILNVEIDKTKESEDTKDDKEAVTPHFEKYAASDWAFTDNSKPLEQLLLHYYGSDIDIDGNGSISIGEAESYYGGIYIIGHGVGGTIDGIEHFKNVELICLPGSQLTGTLPKNMNNYTRLTHLWIYDNNFTGELPDGLLATPTLEEVSIGNGNRFSGKLPNVFSENLQYLLLGDNPLVGDLANTNFSKLNRLSYLDIHSPTVVGNLVDLFSNSTTLQNVNITGSGIIQACPNIPSMDPMNGGYFNYDNLADNLLNGDGTLKDGVTQKDIDRAQESANYWNEPNRGQWQSKITVAQSQFNERDAKKKVSDLLDTNGIIRDSITQTDIDNARNAVNILPNGTLKDGLEAKVNDAQNQFNEKEAKAKVDNLSDINGIIKDYVTQGDIDSAKEAVNKLSNKTLKDELNERLRDIQDQFDEREATFAIIKNFETYSGEGTVTAKIAAPARRVANVYIDGVKLYKNAYEITGKDTLVKVNKNYLSKLEDKEYTVTIEYKGGRKVDLALNVNLKKASHSPTTSLATPTNKGSMIDSSNKVNTMDSTNILIYGGIALVSFVMISLLKRRLLKS